MTNQRSLVRRLARRARVSEAVAADSIDQLVHQLIERLGLRASDAAPKPTDRRSREDGSEDS